MTLIGSPAGLGGTPSSWGLSLAAVNAAAAPSPVRQPSAGARGALDERGGYVRRHVGLFYRRPLSRSQVSARIVTLPRQSHVCAEDHASQSNIQPPSSCCCDSTASR